MVLFRNSPPASGQIGVNHACGVTGQRNRFCGAHEYAFAPFLDFIELAENCLFLDRKRMSAVNETADGQLSIFTDCGFDFQCGALFTFAPPALSTTAMRVTIALATSLFCPSGTENTSDSATMIFLPACTTRDRHKRESPRAGLK